jgi:hypothetical protein
MNHRFAAIAAFALLSLTANLASAHEFPKKAKKVNADLVQNYAACTTPDVTTNGGANACLETDPVDTVCNFPGSGSGKLGISVDKQSLKATAKLQGLAATCEGQTLSVTLGVRTTTDDCANGHCTVVDDVLTIGSCTVSEGNCKIKGSVDTGYPADAGSGMQVVSCGVGRVGFDSFACGLLIP